MKKLYLLAAAGLTSVVASAELPDFRGFSDYTGDSFKITWTPAQDMNLTVFSLTDTEISESQDFSSVITNAQINQDSVAAISDRWTVNVSNGGTTDVAYVEGADHIMLDADGDYVGAILPNAFMKTVRLSAWLANAEGISEENSSRLRIELLDNTGQRFMYGEVFVTLYGTVTEYEFSEAFDGLQNVSGVRFVLEKDDVNNVGDIVINAVSYEYDSPETLLDAQPVSGGEYTVSDCDPAEVYYYVMEDPTTGERSWIETVDGFIPPAPTSPSDIYEDSYTANWGIPYKAQSVTIRNYRMIEFPEGGDFYIFNESFDEATEGTFDEPVEVESLDDYTVRKGWEYAEGAALIANGMVGTKSSPSPWPPRGGYLYSPRVDLAANEGTYTISTKIVGTPGDVITVYRENSMTPDYQLLGNRLTIGEDGTVEQTWTMNDGIDNTSIHIESKGMKQFMLDYFKVSVEVPAGSVMGDLVTTVDIDDTEIQCFTFTDLEPNGLYGYELVAHGYDMYGYERNSGKSEMMTVRLSDPSGIVKVEGNKAVCNINSANGLLCVTPNEDCSVEVYGIDGICLGRNNTSAGKTAMFPVAPGRMVIVRAGSYTAKVATR